MSKATLKTLHWLLVLSGIWLIIAPFLDRSLAVTGAALWSDVVIGLIVGLIGLSELFGRDEGGSQ